MSRSGSFPAAAINSPIKMEKIWNVNWTQLNQTEKAAPGKPGAALVFV